MSSSRSLSSWLEYIERIHPRSVEMGIERIASVRAALRLEPRFPLITVGGTNGKGSVCAMLDAILSAAGYRVGVYSSPHLLEVNERVRVAGVNVTDEELCAAFAEVEMGRGQVPLTYFEYFTLAAMVVFAHRGVDVAVLEVGMGGRLDAVNAFDADVAVLSAIGIDHVEFLGSTREQVAVEKAGIFRRDRPAICGDPSPPPTLAQQAGSIGAELALAGQDFGYAPVADGWRFWSRTQDWEALPSPSLRGEYQYRNASTCLAALSQLQERLPVSRSAIEQGLRNAYIPGRFEIVDHEPQVILDVAHNPHGATALADNLRAQPRDGLTVAVFGMMGNKDIAGVIEAMAGEISAWMVCDLEGPRAAGAERLRAELRQQGITYSVFCYPSPALAYADACRAVGTAGRVVVFGSFVTVAGVIKARAQAGRRTKRGAVGDGVTHRPLQ